MKAVLWCVIGLFVYVLLGIVATALFVFFETRGNPLVGLLLGPIFAVFGLAFSLLGVPAGYLFYKRKHKALAIVTVIALALLGLAVHLFFH